MKSPVYVTNEFERTQRLREIENAETTEQKARDRAKKNLDFVQFQRSGMKEFVSLIRRSPAAAQVLIAMATFMNRGNVMAAEVQVLCDLTNTTRATVSRAIKLLKEEQWVKVCRIGTTRAYQVNSNIFWSAARDLKRFPDVFTANVKSPASSSDRRTKKSETVFRAKPVPIVTSEPKSASVRNNGGNGNG
jgi:hypothetical protein